MFALYYRQKKVFSDIFCLRCCAGKSRSQFSARRRAGTVRERYPGVKWEKVEEKRVLGALYFWGSDRIRIRSNKSPAAIQNGA